MSGPAQDDSGFSTNEGTPLLLLPGQLLANDPTGTSILELGNATGGTVAYDGNGNIVFTPDPDYTGAASFEYLAMDDMGEISIATVSLTVNAINEAPEAVADSGFSTAEDTPLFIAGSTLLANDTDGDNDALSITGVADAVGGTAVLDAQGNITFTPQANYNGPASFTYTISDGNGGFDSATVNLTVTPVNDSPVAAGNSFTLSEDAILTLSPGQLLSNDGDVDGDALTIAGVSDAVGGVVSLNAQGNIVFTPTSNYNGPASFQYAVSDGQGGFANATVNLTITPVNDKPVALNDSFTLAEDTPLVLTPAQLLANDYDIEGGTLSILTVTAAQNGSVSRDAQGNITFTPAANYHGPASFKYVVSDGQGGFTTGTVNLTVTPVNDAPVAGNDGVLTTAEDAPLTIALGSLLANDSDVDGDTLSILSVQNAVGGSVALDQNGNVVFTPGANYNGPASFTYTVSDGNGGTATATVSLDVTPVNDAPAAGNDGVLTTAEDTPLTIAPDSLLANDSDVDADTLSILSVQDAVGGSVALDQNGNVVFTPGVNYNGPASFTYTVSDGNGGTSTATVSLDVTPVNDAPEGIDSAVNGVEDAAYAFSAGDFGYSDVDGDPLAEIRIDTLPAAGQGSLTLNGVAVAAGQVIAAADIGGLVYAPVANANGAASFTFSVGDGQLFDSSPNTMTVNVAPVNDAPNAVDDGGSAGGNWSISAISTRAATGLSAIHQLGAGDFNGDGAIDLVAETNAAHSGGNGIIFGAAGSLATVLNGGNFASAAANGPAVFKFAGYNGTAGIGDVTNDGFMDVIAATGSTTASVRLGGTTADNVADQNLSLGIGYSPTANAVVADFNGDGHADLFMSTANSSAVNGASATSPALAMWLGTASGIANTPTATAYSGISPVGVASLFNVAYALGATDLNGDGYADIVTNVGARNDGQANYGPAKVTFGNAAGTFASNMADSAGGLILSNFDVAGGDPLARNVAGGGDVNGDGLQDLLGWNEAGAGGFALFGSSSYTAGSSVNIATLNGQNGVRFTGTGSTVTEMAMGDLNGDGIDDIVLGSQAAASGAGKLWVVWGKEGGFGAGSIDLSQQSTGQFVTLTGAAGQGIGSALQIADIDGDGLNDLVVGSSSGTIDVVSGEQFDGVVAEPVPGYVAFEDTPLTINPAQLLANDSDIDGDALTIQSVQNAIGGTVGLDQNGNVVFTPNANYSGPASFTYTVSDGNGGTDTATVKLTVRPDDLALSSVAVRAASNTGHVSRLTSGDFTGDGIADIMLSASTYGMIASDEGNLATALNGGDFGAAAVNGPMTFKFSANAAGYGDTDNDGLADAIGLEGSLYRTVAIRKGSGTPDNATDQSLNSGIGYSGNSAVVADFNGDGLADIFTGAGNSSGVNGASSTSPALAMWLGNADGFTTAPTATAYSGITPLGNASLANFGWAIGAADINGDGFDDIFTSVGTRNDGYVNYGVAKVTFGNAAGTFAANMASGDGGLILNNFAFAGGDALYRNIATGGDVNGDGLADVAGWTGSYPSKPTGGFVLFGDDAYTAGGSVDIAALNGQNGVKLTGVSSGVDSMALGDLNGDGLADMVVGSQGAASGAGKLWVVWGKEGGFASGSIDLSQESTGQFITLTGAAGQGIGSALTVADIDGDGLNDLVVGSSSGTIDVVSGEQFGASVDSLVNAMASFSAPMGSLETMPPPPSEQEILLASAA